MNWSIEVYLKEIKQNLGRLKEQSPAYVSHHSSIHITAVRYMLLLHGVISEGDIAFTEYRNSITDSIEVLTFSALLWKVFKNVIYGVLDSFEKLFGKETLNKMKSKISCFIENMLEKALQIDENYIKAEIKEEKVGALI